MKKGTFVAGTAVVAAAAAAGYFLLRPQPTPEDVKAPADEQFKKMEIVLNDLEAKVKQPESNVDSLFQVLDALKWQKTGTDEYEQQKQNLYLNHKKDVAMTFCKVIQERGLDITHPHLDDVESISE